MLRLALTTAAVASGGDVEFLKKATRLEGWLRSACRGSKDPIVLLCDWREAKPCYDAVLSSALSLQPVCLIVQTDTLKVSYRASQWAAGLSRMQTETRRGQISVAVLPVSESRRAEAIAGVAAVFAAGQEGAWITSVTPERFQWTPERPSATSTPLASSAGSAVSDGGSEIERTDVFSLLRDAGFIDANLVNGMFDDIVTLLTSAVPECYED